VTRAIGRIVDAFDEDERAGARVALAATLRMAVAQTLLRDHNGRRVPAVEVVHGCTPVSALIRDGKEHELASFIESSRGRGMKLLDDSLVELVQTASVSPDEARWFAVHKDVFARRVEQPARARS
jgi:twitching motility protein PilT